MTIPVFLSREVVQLVHRTSLEEFGGIEGIRDEGLIESALASAVNTYLYSGGDQFDIAAAYAFHLSESQGFLDGNKRTGLKAALLFLMGNGEETEFDQTSLLNAMLVHGPARDD